MWLNKIACVGEYMWCDKKEKDENTSINDDEFELDDTEDTVKPKNSKFNFLKKVEENIDLGEKVQEERLEERS